MDSQLNMSKYYLNLQLQPLKNYLKIKFKFKMKEASSFSLQDYKIQRQYREEKRKQYLNQFQLLRQRMGISQITQQNKSAIPRTDNVKNEQKQQERVSKKVEPEPEPGLVQQNNKLKAKLVELQSQQRVKLNKFKQQISSAKQQYIGKIKQINEMATAQKSQTQAKIAKMEQQIKGAVLKNEQIEAFNKRVQEECSKGLEVMQKYANQIKQQYDEKLEQFNNVFNTSNQKILHLEEQYNEEQFIDTTLQNQELVNSIKQNATKAEEDIDKILSDYKELLSGKTEIFDSLAQNNKMKEQQIEKMATLEEKLKTIFQKLNEQKKIYLDENKKMADELIQVKELLTKAMGS